MGLLRSETMSHGMLVLPVQDARKYIAKIGKETAIQFEDMNSREMRRPYRKYIQRIDEMERILRFVFEEIGKMEGKTIIRNKLNEFLEADNQEMYNLETVEGELQQLYQTFMKSKENNAKLVEERNQCAEEAEVAGVAARLFATPGGAKPTDDSEAARSKEEGISRLGYLAGVLPKADEMRFARALWRASSGTTFTQFFPIDAKVMDSKTGQEVQKSVFVVYFQGETGYLSQKILKVCNAFGVNMYAWPANGGKAAEKHRTLTATLKEKDRTVAAFQQAMEVEAKDLLEPPAAGLNSKIEEWRLFCIKEKSIYSILNLCQEGMTLQVDIWYPAAEEQNIRQLLESVKAPQKAMLMADKTAPKATPPTYIRTNEYTEAWQEVINTYGIPKYQEANPALLTIITFPFIFGMMYGDVGHGFLLFCTGCWCCMNSENLRFSVPALFTARYMILSLGIFSIFAGFMYNDFFSLGLQLFDSRFEDPDGDGHWSPRSGVDVKNQGGPGPYPFGLDWAWAGASNELLYLNSMKMKLSVLFGVLQMVVGVMLRWSNALHEKNWVDFIFECLPMMVFMICFFGWMDAMILYKWVNPIDNPPSIINSLICMAMGQEDKFPLWDGSVELAQTLMKYTVISVPIMLLPKPFVLLYQHNRKQSKAAGQGVQEPLLGANDSPLGAGATGGMQVVQDVEAGPGAHNAHGHGEEFEFGEVFIHQIIETIEFVLGTVSHTASYLRIWALSLAHQQLSLVFFQKTLQMGLELPYPMNGIALYFLFAAWFGITLGVLMGMDVLECFLHTLRLHWVEFQSKFYKADGEKFAPYSIRALVEPTD